MQAATAALTRRESGLAHWLAPLALFVIAGLVYAINLDRLPHPDEYYHILAAQGMVATGEPRIAEGLYTRVLLHTWLVAQSFDWFGESLATSRLPSLLAAALLVATLFAWLRREAGPLAAWIGAGLFLISPFAVDMAQFCRFYALQSLAMFLTAILAHAGVRSGALGQRLGLFALAAVTLAFAVYLQPTSLLGAMGLGVWTVGAIGLPWLTDPVVSRSRKLATMGGLGVAGLAVVGAALASGLVADLWAQYSSTPFFNQRTSDQFWFYHGWYSLLYPSLWPLTGLLALLALTVRPLAASMLLTVFAAGFLLNSFAAAKNLRYIAYAQPFLFALWGIALAALWPQLLAFARQLRDRLGRQLAWFGGARGLAGLLLAAAIGFLGIANAATIRTAMLLADVTVPPEQPRTNWPAAREALAPWLERADIVVSTEELGHLYFLGRYDVRFSPSKMGELDPAEQREFGIDHRTGRPVIALGETLERILACYPSGIIVGPAAHWGRPELINDDLARLIEEKAQPLELPRRSQLRAFVWERLPAADADCAGLPRFPHSPPAAG